MKDSDTLLVGYDKSSGHDVAILIVGRKAPGEAVEIVNQFQGEEAVELYSKLLKKTEGDLK